MFTETSLGLTVVSNSRLSLIEEPCSPVSLTYSWISEKSSAELGGLLKSAYHSLREKEKDLELVAQVGQSLLEYNQNLKKDYEHLLKNASEINEQQSQRLVSDKTAYETIIHTLHQKNEEIQCMLEHSKQHSQLSEQRRERHQRKLQTEIKALQNSLEQATQKILELEESKTRMEERANQQYQGHVEQQRKDVAILEELSLQIEELHRENKYYQKSKRRVEDKLRSAIQDLESLRVEFKQFGSMQQGYGALQKAYQKQTGHVRELNERLEERSDEVRALYQRLEAGQKTQQHLRLTADKCHLMHELSAAKVHVFSWLSQCHESTLAERQGASTFVPGDHTSLHGVQKARPPSPLYPPSSQPPARTYNCPYVYTVYGHLSRWCRFTLILMASIVINFWKGPDILFEK
ncbi:hypothetical protein BY458DRAFT_552969 [Sporodiniella umbellata]|nr:hypothetical protein BY458DRAFT_552969 [Sporodiniella umbellata]